MKTDKQLRLPVKPKPACAVLVTDKHGEILDIIPYSHRAKALQATRGALKFAAMFDREIFIIERKELKK